MHSPSEFTELLVHAQEGDDQAREVLLGAAYDELRNLARGYLDRERSDHTLQATALVHEVCVRMLGGEALPGKSRPQFLAYCAKAMRRILINHARSRGRVKRGGGAARLPLAEDLVVGGETPADLLALDEALERLASTAPRKSDVVELRYFGGLTVEEVAQVLDISPRTVKRDWEIAGTLLLRYLGRDEGDGV